MTHTPEPITIEVVGTHQGAEESLPAITAFARRSARPVHIAATDPLPGRAPRFAQLLRDNGIAASAREERFQHVQPQGFAENTTILLHTDSPDANADILAQAADAPYAVKGFLFVRTPDQRLLGVRASAGPQEADAKRDLAKFFRALHAVTARTDSRFVLGDQGIPAHRAIAPEHRASFRRFLTDQLDRSLAGLPTTSPGLEISLDARTTLPVFLVDSTMGFQDPGDLATRFVANPPAPIYPGMDFFIGELGPDGVRLHRTRYRLTDGRAGLYDTVGLDPASLLQADERQRQETQRAIERAERSTITRRSPVFVTD